MTSGARRALVTLALSGCGGAADGNVAEGLRAAPSVTVAIPQAPTAPARPSGKPAIVIENHSTAAIDLYRGWIVDEEGKLGTMALWPRPSDCPRYEPKEHRLPLRGFLELAPPTHAYDEERCAPGQALPPGRYVIHIESGYGAELHASGEVSLPLAEPVVLRMERHEQAPRCDARRARRAARLVLASALAAGAPPALLRGCDPDAAACGSLPLPEEEPPRKCAMTLHETLLRVRLPPGGPKEISSWLDSEVVFARRPVVSRSTSAELSLGGGRVVLEGLTQEHLHIHGGDPARIGNMQVRVFNRSGRTLQVKALGVDWLTDHGCGEPKATGPRLAVLGYQPASLAEGTTTLSIRFAEQGAYQAHCDIFASRAHLEVEGRPIAVTSEHGVTREEPFDLER